MAGELTEEIFCVDPTARGFHICKKIQRLPSLMQPSQFMHYPLFNASGHLDKQLVYKFVWLCKTRFSQLLYASMDVGI